MTAAHTPDLLATIVAATRRSVEVRKEVRPLSELEHRQGRQPNGRTFVDALQVSPAPRVIAECKRRSPSRGILRSDYYPAAHARSYEASGAAAISILTEPTFFDGSPEHLQVVRAAVGLPLLRKDFILSEYQIHEAAWLGADAVLLIAAALSERSLRELLIIARGRRLAALVEVHDESELARAIDAGAELIGVNSRNLKTLAVDPDIHHRLLGGMPDYAIKVAESGIRSADDMRRLTAAGYDAFLVGEGLIAQPDPGAALRELRAV